MSFYLNPGNKVFWELVRSIIYVDKTGLIAFINGLINTKEKFICVSRPRRFGKSMTLEMLCWRLTTEWGDIIMLEHEPLVCIILVNYNGYNDTKVCVESLQKVNYRNYKIIILDNCSKDASALKNDVELNEIADILYSDTNSGFSGGNNIGIEYAKKYSPEYILLLNNDTEVTPDFLGNLVVIAEKNNNVGIVTGNIFYFSDKSKYWYAGGDYDFKTGYTNPVKFKNEISPEPRDVTFASGCVMLISQKCLSECGNLCEDFFLYSEDTEYCCRVLNNGFRIIWAPDSVVYHKVSASTGNNSKFQQYYLVRNNLYIVKKFGKNKCFAYFYRLYCCLKEIVKGNYNIVPVFFAYLDFARGVKGRSKKY